MALSEIPERAATKNSSRRASCALVSVRTADFKNVGAERAARRALACKLPRVGLNRNRGTRECVPLFDIPPTRRSEWKDSAERNSISTYWAKGETASAVHGDGLSPARERHPPPDDGPLRSMAGPTRRAPVPGVVLPGQVVEPQLEQVRLSRIRWPIRKSAAEAITPTIRVVTRERPLTGLRAVIS